MSRQTLRTSYVPIFFDRHGLLSLVHKMRGKYIANVDDIRPQFRTDENAFLSQNAIFNSTLTRSNGLGAGATIDQFSGQRLDEVSGFKEEALPAFSDQILFPAGALAAPRKLALRAGWRFSASRLLNEVCVSATMLSPRCRRTFVARYVESWQVVKRKTRCFAVE